MFNFNVYSGLLLVGCLQALVFAFVLFIRWRRDERPNDLFASIILLVGGFYAAQWMLGFAGWYDDRDWRSTVMFYMDWDQLATLGPLIWLYFRSLTNTDFRWEKKYWLHFLPAILFLVPPIAFLLYDFVLHAWLGGNTFEGFGGSRGPAMEFKHSNEVMEIVSTAKDVFTRFQLPVYLILTLKEYRRYRAYVADQFANGTEYFLQGLRILLYIFLVGIGLAFLSEVFALVSGVDSYSDVWPRYFAISVLVYAAAIQFYSLDARRTRQLRFEPEEKDTPKEEPPVDLEPWVARLDKRLKDHQDFLEPDLKLADLAERLGTNTSILSKVINTHFGMNFNDFINAKRSDSFLQRLQKGEHKQHTLLSLALDSGFNSKSTFNRAFKKQMGYSPGQAIKNLASD